MLELPTGKFGVINADPPWSWDAWSAKGEAKSAKNHYSCMSIDDICEMPIGSLAAENCALFIWATWPTIFQTQKVIEAWGFTYSGLAWEWIKFNPKTGKFSFGTGYGSRKNCEPLLLARRGKPILKSHSIRDFLFAPRREHSRKPDESFDRIESMYDGPYLDLFARSSRPGWTSWGLEREKFDAN